ncbi:MAG: DUF2878 domain-containing protein [Acidobacteriota bacterium]|nr:DUF2878 domain-containing protein [Blastocatellia bacterium]MDW8411787.1 DUF2878 domain-containing protein [Acidobacteriota bacterium]
MKLSTGINILGIQFGWFACVLGAASGKVWLGLLAVAIHLGLHLLITKRKALRNELAFLLFAALVGIMVDGAKKGLGIAVYAADDGIFPAPIWILAMWLLFATSFSTSLSWLRGKLALAAIIGAVSGPTAYLAAMRLGAVALPLGELPTAAILAVVWAAVLALFAWASNKPFGGEHG